MKIFTISRSWIDRPPRQVLPWVGILIVWGLLYLPKLRTVPGWYGDETLTFIVSRDLFHGIASNLSLWNTFWHPHYPYQQLYSWFCGLAAALVGNDILGGRFFNALLALSGALLIWRIGAAPFGNKAALFAAILFLGYYQSIIHYRMCYAHNAAGVGFVGMTLFLLRDNSWKSNLLAGSCLAIAAGSHPIFIYGACAALLCRFSSPKSWIPLFLPSAIIVISSLSISWCRFGPWLIEDLRHLQSTFGSRAGIDGGGFQGFLNLYRFITQDWFHIGATVGIILSFHRKFYPLALVAIISLILLTKNRANLTIFYYQAVIVLPVLALCWARIYEFVATQRIMSDKKYLEVLLWLIPLLSFGVNFLHLEEGKLLPLNQYWVTQSTDEVEAAAQWINRHTVEEDSVGGNANISWLLKAHTIPYLQMVTWYGYPTQGYENGNKKERFRFDASLEHVKYAVVGDIDRRWAFGEPNVAVITQKIQEQKWPLVWQGPNYMIFENPRLKEEN